MYVFKLFLTNEKCSEHRIRRKKKKEFDYLLVQKVCVYANRKKREKIKKRKWVQLPWKPDLQKKEEKKNFGLIVDFYCIL